MPENHEFEKAMQQQLDGFQVTPSPSDWQAVYQQLHPDKKRRPLWWWIPALMMMLAIGWYISKEPNGAGQTAIKPPANHAISKASAEKSTQSNKDNDTQVDHATTNHQQEENLITENDGEKQTNVTSESNERASGRILEKRNADEAPYNRQTYKSKENHAAENNQVVGNKNAVSNAEEILPLAGNTQAINSEQIADASVSMMDLPAYNLTPLYNASLKNGVTNAQPLQSPLNMQSQLQLQMEAATIANKKANPKWQWGAYAGIGANRLTEPIGMMKSSADNNVAAGSGSSRVVTSSTEQNGWHYNVGFFVNRKWKPNWQFTTGLGFNASTWKTAGITYVDSILPAGTFYSRALVSTAQKDYTMWMAELTILISNRIAGKGFGTLWWTAGINNQFLVTLKQQTASSSVSNNFAITSDEKSLKDGVNKYQPQLRAGFMYDYAGKKSHWQLLPMVNVSLVKPLETGDFNLMNIQLQGRWFFGKN